MRTLRTLERKQKDFMKCKLNNGACLCLRGASSHLARPDPPLPKGLFPTSWVWVLIYPGLDYPLSTLQTRN